MPSSSSGIEIMYSDSDLSDDDDMEIDMVLESVVAR